MARTYGNYSSLIDFTRASSGTALRPISYGDEFVTNGGFDTDTSGWSEASTYEGTTLSIVSGELKIVADPARGMGRAYQEISTTVGKVYKATCVARRDASGSQVRLKASNTYSLDGAFANSDINTTTDNIVLEIVFVASSTSTYIGPEVSGGSATSGYFDNISVREVLFDQPNGTLTLFNHPTNVPRIEYDAQGNRLGLLVEESRTNLITYSEDFSVRPWSGANGGVINHAQTISPSGTLSASYVDLSASSSAYIISSYVSTSGATTVCYSFFVKGTAGETIGVKINNNAQGTITATDGTQTSVIAEKLIELTGKWQRVFIYITNSVALTRAYLYLGDRRTGQTAQEFFVWGAQLEAGSFPTSYIPTSGATATRSADVASIGVSEFGYNQKAGTLFVEATLQNADGVSVPAMFSDGTSSERFYARVNNGPYNLSLAVINSGVVQANIDSGVDAVFEQTFAFAGAIKENDFSVSVDGQTAVTDTSGTLPSGITKMNIGSDHTNVIEMQGHIKSIKYYPRRLTNAQLQELTS